MHKEGFYSSGQFAKLADVSVRTIRYYDRMNLLKPSYVGEGGARFYTDRDLASLQQILLLKYLGFSLEEIRTMTIGGGDPGHLSRMLKVQEKLVRDRIEQMQTVADAILDTERQVQSGRIDWKDLLSLIHLTGMERSMASQYQSASNLSARIALHSLFSTNQEGWFPWLFRQLDLKGGMQVLEVGCGDGALWIQNQYRVPQSLHLVLSDRSDGMIRDARRNFAQVSQSASLSQADLSFHTFDCAKIPYPDQTFDLVIADHLLFYVEDLPSVVRELARVLRRGGRLVCSTYSRRHMQQIRDLVREFDSHIILSKDSLYERFGLENGEKVLKQAFPRVFSLLYEDSLQITDAQPLIEYVLSCHGNQNEYLVNRYKEFRTFVEGKVKGGFSVTKEAGIFECTRD